MNERSFVGIEVMSTDAGACYGNIDTLVAPESENEELLIAGWALDPNGAAFRRIWLACGAQCAEASIGLARPDVGLAYPELMDGATSGYELRCQLPSGNHLATLWGEIAEGDTRLLAEVPLHIAPPPIRAQIETPAGSRGEAGLLRISGWCFHPGQRVLKLQLRLGESIHECRHGIQRRDVAEAFAAYSGAGESGFEVSLDLAPGQYTMALEAILESGQTTVLALPVPLRVRGQAAWIRASRKLGDAGRFASFALAKAQKWRRTRGRLPRLSELPTLASKALYLFRQTQVTQNQGLAPPRGFNLPPREEPYASWLRWNQWNERRHRECLARLENLRKQPLISVIMPVYEPPRACLEAAVRSVQHQIYQNWELCVCDDAGEASSVFDDLQNSASADGRIKLTRSERNLGIGAASNAAAALATGEFLVFLDHDDLLTPDALAEVALHLDTNPDTDFVYSDDDKIDLAGERFAPQFKPNWSPELLLSYMYFSHLSAVRRGLFIELGGIREGYDGSQDYDFALRATERARRVGHIPKILYHWRALPGSTAQSGRAKPASLDAGLRAVQGALDRRGIHAAAFQPRWAESDGLGIFLHRFPDQGPSVTVIIPTRNGHDVLKTCLQSLHKTSYRNFDVLIIDNASDDAATLDLIARSGHRVLRLENPPVGFSYAYINNRAALECQSDYLVFLNDDTEVLAPEWLNQLVGYAEIPGVGAVGARLLFPDGLVQHAGIVHGYYDGMAGPAHKLLPRWYGGYLSYAMVPRNYLAVTAACLLVRRQTFLEHGGFDEARFGVAYNDVDFCYRLADAGLRSVYAPGAELHHYEGHSRAKGDKPAEEAHFRRLHGRRVDPYYNPNLSLANERFEILARASETERPQAGIKALMVGFTLKLEGAPFSQFEMTKGLRQRGVLKPVVYCPEEGPLRALYEAEGIEVIVRPHPLEGVYDANSYRRAVEAFSRFISELGVDVVYGNTLQTFYAIAAAELANLPTIWNPRESEPWQTYFIQFGEQVAVEALRCFAYPYRIVFVSDATRQGCEALNTHNNFTVVHNGLDPTRAAAARDAFPREAGRRALGLGDEETMVLLLGTVCERKGQLDLINAIALLEERQGLGAMHFFLVGDRKGLYSMQLHAAIEQLPASARSRIQVVPETDEAALYLGAADVFVCSSRVESYPRVILEAMYFGLAIVTTPVYGITEQLVDGSSALFFAPGDAPGLAALLDRLEGNPELRRELGASASLRLQRLTSFEEMLDRYERIFVESYYSRAGGAAGGSGLEGR